MYNCITKCKLADYQIHDDKLCRNIGMEIKQLNKKEAAF